VIAFETKPGDGCEDANFGLCQFPSHVSHPELGMVQTNLDGWSWHSFCKTHYASDPRCGGCPIFCAATWASLRSWTRPRGSGFWAR
jgi:hypothetical protein